MVVSKFGGITVEEEGIKSKFGGISLPQEPEALGFEALPPAARAFSFVNKAIAETIGAPVDVIAGALSLIPGVDIEAPILGSENIKRLMESRINFGGTVLPRGRKPETLPDFIGTGIGEAVSLLTPAGLGVKALAKGTGLVGKIASSIQSSIISHPFLTTLSEVTAGAGAGTGRFTGEAIDPESPLVGTAAEITGGLVGGLAPSVLQAFSPGLIVLRTGKTFFKKASLPFTEQGSKFRAAQFVKSQVARPEEVAARLDEPTLGDLPPAVAIAEKRITELFKSLIGQDALSDAETVEKISKSIMKLESEIRKLGFEGDPNIMVEITQKRVAAIELSMEKRAAGAMEAIF